MKRIENENIYIEQYLDRRENVGFVSPKIMAAGILKEKVDEEDYFIKRIIVFELFIRQIKEEYEC